MPAGTRHSAVCAALGLHHACLKKVLENPHLMDAETEVTRVKYISKGAGLVGLEMGLSNCDFTVLTADLTAPARIGSGGDSCSLRLLCALEITAGSDPIENESSM